MFDVHDWVVDWEKAGDLTPLAGVWGSDFDVVGVDGRYERSGSVYW